MDKIELAIMRKFLNSVLVTAHWFINRIERKHPGEAPPEKLQELKNLIKELEQERDEMEREDQ